MQWLESLCVECKKMKRCLEISEKCANSDPSKIPTVGEITLTLNQTATTIQRVPPVVTDPRNDLTSSLYKVGSFQPNNNNIIFSC